MKGTRAGTSLIAGTSSRSRVRPGRGPKKTRLKESPKKTPRRRRWTAEEIRQLRKLYPTRSNQEIAEALGRPLSGVIAQAFHLGLRKTSRRLATMGRENIAVRWGPRRRGRRRRPRPTRTVKTRR